MENKAPKMIRDWLTEEGRKVAWLAARVGVDRPAVSNWLRGQHIPTRANRKALADVTGLAVETEEVWL